MKPKSILGILLLVAVSFSAASQADNGTYLNISVAEVTYEEDPFPDFEPTMLVARFGKIFGSGLGIEGRVAGGIDGDSQDFDVPILGRTELEVEVDLIYGLYLVGQANLGGNVSIYAVAGVNMVELSATAVSDGTKFVNSDDESGAAFGGGITFGPTDKPHVTLEYMSYLDEDEFDLSAISVGVIF